MHPAIEVVDRLIKERELAKKAKGSYSYPYGHGMMYECLGCGAKSIDDCITNHKEDCPDKAYDELKGVNIDQLKLLRELVVDTLGLKI